MSLPARLSESQNTTSAPVVDMRGIVKRFGQTTALNGVSLSIARGEIHAIVGENGAGKSTLMHSLAGGLQPDQGKIMIQGVPQSIRSVEAANALGIAMVHQHFMLVPSLTAAENLTLGREPRRYGLFDRQAAAHTLTKLGERYHLKVNPLARVADLSVGDLQRLEILRALYRGAEILILDEPTGVLTPQETQGLFRVLRELAMAGKTTIFISHKLEEVLEISETITVMRDGHVTGTLKTSTTTTGELARLMVGRDVFLQFDKTKATAGAPVLEVDRLTASNVKRVSFQVRSGEIVGIAGVTGNGQTELADLIAGLSPLVSGSIRLSGQDITYTSVEARRAAGLANIPEDRYKHGLAASASIADNLLMGQHQRAPFARRGLLNHRLIRERVTHLIQQFNIKTKHANNNISTLSGGNAQKIIVARELADEKPFILAAQPTRGIDIAASEFVRSTLLERRNRGAGILLISADLNEILSLSDRILVMYEGRIVGEVAAQDANEMQLGLLMAGITEASAND